MFAGTKRQYRIGVHYIATRFIHVFTVLLIGSITPYIIYMARSV